MRCELCQMEKNHLYEQKLPKIILLTVLPYWYFHHLPYFFICSVFFPTSRVPILLSITHQYYFKHIQHIPKSISFIVPPANSPSRILCPLILINPVALPAGSVLIAVTWDISSHLSSVGFYCSHSHPLSFMAY